VVALLKLQSKGGFTMGYRFRKQSGDIGKPKPSSEGPERTSIFLSALRTTAPTVFSIAVGFTVLGYLALARNGEDSVTIGYVTVPPGTGAVVFGLLAAILFWVVLAALYRPYTAADCASRRNYNLLREKLDRLEIRLKHAMLRGYGPQEVSEPDNGALKTTRKQAFEQAKQECRKIRRGLESSGMPWVTGVGYIELWHRMHRADEALIKIEPYPMVLEGAMRDESRLMNATMANRDVLLKRLTCAAAMLDNSAKQGERLIYLTQTVEAECSLPKKQERVKPETRATALAMLSDVRYEINHFRDENWEGLVNARNRLADSSALLGFAAYALLGLAIFMNVPHDTVVWVSTYFLIGALTGLFARAQAEWNAESAIDDFGLATARLLEIPWLSGLSAVGGVLVISVVDGSFAEGPQKLHELERIFDSRPLLFIISAVFGLAPDLLLRRLGQEVEKYKEDLQSTQSSQSETDIQDTRSGRRSRSASTQTQPG
jgi:hypothetical protein